MKVRMKMAVAGQFWNREGGVQVGDVIDIDNDDEAENMIALGYCEKADQRVKEEFATAAPVDEEHAVAQRGGDEDVAEEEKVAVVPEVKEESVKRSPGRPRKA